ETNDVAPKHPALAACLEQYQLSVATENARFYEAHATAIRGFTRLYEFDSAEALTKEQQAFHSAASSKYGRFFAHGTFWHGNHKIDRATTYEFKVPPGKKVLCAFSFPSKNENGIDLSDSCLKRLAGAGNYGKEKPIVLEPKPFETTIYFSSVCKAGPPDGKLPWQM